MHVVGCKPNYFIYYVLLCTTADRYALTTFRASETQQRAIQYFENRVHPPDNCTCGRDKPIEVSCFASKVSSCFLKYGCSTWCITCLYKGLLLRSIVRASGEFSNNTFTVAGSLDLEAKARGL